MLPFEQYSKIINNYCILYSGYSDEYLVLLKFLTSAIEKQYFPIKLTIACKDDKVHLAGKNAVGLSQLNKRLYSYVYTLSYDGIRHPIEHLIEDSKIRFNFIDSTKSLLTNRAVIITQGNHPTKSLTSLQIEKLRQKLLDKGFSVEINGNVEFAGCVAGVESPDLFNAAINETMTFLVPTGIGTRLYKKLFLKGEVWDI
jgi:regulator of extracellular matrix RemA (YlzA/DUF370 family)